MALGAQYTSTTTAFRLTATPATGVALPLTDPSQYGQRPVGVYLQATTQDIRFTADGVTTPTASVGALLVAGAAPWLYYGPLVDLQFIRATAGSVLNVIYTTQPQAAIGADGATGAAGAAGATGATGPASAADVNAVLDANELDVLVVGIPEADLTPPLDAYGNGLATFSAKYTVGNSISDTIFTRYEGPTDSGGNCIAGVSMGGFPIGAQFDAVINGDGGVGTSYYAYVRVLAGIDADTCNPIFVASPTLVDDATSVNAVGIDIANQQVTGVTTGISLRTGLGKSVFGDFIVIQRHTAPADGDLAAGDCALWFDQTNGAGKFMIKAKTANGTVATAAVALT